MRDCWNPAIPTDSIDQKRLQQIREGLDHIGYTVGVQANGRMHCVLREASNAKIAVPHGTWNINDWFAKRSRRMTRRWPASQWNCTASTVGADDLPPWSGA